MSSRNRKDVKVERNDSKKKVKYLPKRDRINALDMWPSYCTKRNVAEDTILYCKNRINVLNEAESKLAKNVPKPKLLKYLEDYFEDQMFIHGIKETDVNPVRLQVYREIFDWLIESFKTYKPLLARIKKEYETNLSILKEEIRKLEPMKEMLWTIAEESDQQIINIKKEENKEITQLKKNISDYIALLSEHDANNVTLQYEVHELSKSLRLEHEAYRKECDTKKLLILDINDLRAQLDDIEQIKRDRVAVNEEDPTMLRFALEEAQKAHSAVVKKLSETIAVYSNSIPVTTHEALENKHQILLAEFKRVSDAFVTLESQFKSLEERSNALNSQRDFYYLKYMDLAKSTSPNTGTLIEKLADVGGTDRWTNLAGRGKTTSQLAQTILDDLKDENFQKNKDSILDEELSSWSENDDEKKTYRKSISSKHAPKENLAMMRTMIEMMCELPPGSISPNFDPLQLLPILNKEKLQKENSKEKGKTKKTE